MGSSARGMDQPRPKVNDAKSVSADVPMKPKPKADGTLLVARSLPSKAAKQLGLPERFNAADLGAKTRAYLKFHRETVSRGQQLS